MATRTNTTVASKIDRAAVMRAAWALYHHWHSVRESIHGPMAFDRAQFAWKLQFAWAKAHEARLSDTERRRAKFKKEIDGLKFKPAHVNTEPTRARLEAELRSLAA